jgi:hypothetical protein
MLTLRYNKDTGRFIGINAEGYPAVASVLKRRDTVPVVVMLYSAGVLTTFSSGSLSLGLKARGSYTGPLVALANLTASGSSSYTGTLSLNTVELAALFVGVGLPPTEPAYVPLVAELSHTSGWTAENIPVRCDNDYLSGDEPAPGQSVSEFAALLAAETARATAAEMASARAVASDFEMVLKNSVKIQSPEIGKVFGKRVNRWTHTEDITRATNLSASSVNAADFITLNGIKLQRWTPIPGQGLYAFLSSRISAAYELLTAGKSYIVSAYVVNVKGAATCGMANMAATGFGHEQKYIDNQLRRIWTYGVAIDSNRMDYGRTPTVAYGSAASVGDDQGVGYIAGCDYNVEADCYIGGIQVEEIPAQKMSIAMIGDSTMRGGFGSEVAPYTSNLGGDNYDSRQVSRYLEWALNVPVLCRAVSGNTTAMMAARWAADITPLAHRSRYCVIQGGINDFGTGVSLATFQTNFTALRTLALADGMIPVMMTITPFGASGTMESNRLAANAWIRANFPFVIDAAEVVKDPFDASKLRNESGWINDGTHYGDNAKRAIGFYAATLSFWDFPKPSAYEKVGTSYLPPNTYTVATLPTGSMGDTAHVTDATAPTYRGALVGGGAVVVPVFHNGSAWVSC